jgi:hypothetical protein
MPHACCMPHACIQYKHSTTHCITHHLLLNTHSKLDNCDNYWMRSSLSDDGGGVMCCDPHSHCWHPPCSASLPCPYLHPAQQTPLLHLLRPALKCPCCHLPSLPLHLSCPLLPLSCPPPPRPLPPRCCLRPAWPTWWRTGLTHVPAARCGCRSP